jgi:hypothetical protein
MWGFNSIKRGRRPIRHKRNRTVRKRTLSLEDLEGRSLLSVVPPAWQPTSTDPLDVKNGPLANAGQTLISIYAEFQDFIKLQPDSRFVSSFSEIVEFRGNEVGIEVRGWGDLGTFVSSLRNLGMEVTATDELTGTVDGFLPINSLLAAAQLEQTVGLSPIFVPKTNLVPVANDPGPVSGFTSNPIEGSNTAVAPPVDPVGPTPVSTGPASPVEPSSNQDIAPVVPSQRHASRLNPRAISTQRARRPLLARVVHTGLSPRALPHPTPFRLTFLHRVK